MSLEPSLGLCHPTLHALEKMLSGEERIREESLWALWGWGWGVLTSAQQGKFFFPSGPPHVLPQLWQ